MPGGHAAHACEISAAVVAKTKNPPAASMSFLIESLLVERHNLGAYPQNITTARRA